MINPARLALARRRRGWTKARLASAVGITARTLQRYESDTSHSPGPDVLAAIARTLDFPIEFFVMGAEPELVGADSASFRSLSKMTARQRDAALSAASLAFDLADWIDARFRLPQVTVPKVEQGVDPETAAGMVRAAWGIGERPIRHVIHHLEASGVRVFSIADEAREADAYSLWRPRTGEPFVFLNTKKSAERRRFDAAHELGHLVLHWHHVLPQGRQAEEESNAFASALLMPAAAILATAPRFPTVQSILVHKRRWQVSAMAYTYRLHKLGLLSEWRYRSIAADLSQQGFRAGEPMSALHPETSQVLAKVFASLRSTGVTKADIARDLNFYVRDIESLVFELATVGVAPTTPLSLSPEQVAAFERRPAPAPLRVVEG